MKITTIQAVIDSAEVLGKVHEATNITSHEMTIHGIESVDDLKKIAKQQGGHFWGENNLASSYAWCTCNLGNIEFILTNKKIK